MSPDQIASYTTRRTDILSCVPSDSLCVLDVGCSDGALGAALKRQNPNRTVYGVEYSRDFCAVAEARLDRIVQADLNDFAWDDYFPKASIDCLILADVLEHLIDPWGVLGQAGARLASGGTAIVCLPNIRHVSAIHSVWICGTFPRRTRGIFDQTHLRWFTLRDARDLCEGAGLAVQEIVPRLRVLDRPGGRLNNFVERRMTRFARLGIIMQFLAYQYILVCRRV